jgi:hypothetical protein
MLEIISPSAILPRARALLAARCIRSGMSGGAQY